tara:strand:+ start:744 stop:1802 length:1059 start_codon:yes stop_codon:yes gene_type:complete
MNIIFFNTIALGDYLVQSKLIKDFKLKYKCHITAVCSKYNGRIISKQDHIDQIIYYDRNGSFVQKINTLKKILKKKYFLSIVFDCQKFSMLANFILNSKFKRGILMQKFINIFSLKFYLYYPSKLLSFFLYDKHIIHKRIKFIDKVYYLPQTWIDLLSDFKLRTKKNNVYYFNPMKLQNDHKNKLLKKLNIKNYVIFHLDHKWEDILNIKNDLFEQLVYFQKKTKKKILISSFHNKSIYFKNILKKINIFNMNNSMLIKRNNLPIYLIKDPEIFFQERLISTSELCISCHSGILVHSAGANKRKLVDILNENEVLIQKCWAPLKNYYVVKKSNNLKRYDISLIFDNIKKIIN